jgi:predicted lipoprotein with Yx(FWY)xxD motif
MVGALSGRIVTKPESIQRTSAMPRAFAAAAFAVALGAVIAGGVAAAAAVPITPADVSLIQEGHTYVFRSDDSLPLYTFDKDAPGRSNCTGPCAAAWPPLTASQGSRPVGDWTLVERADGKLQWAWRGKPVYTHTGDGADKPAGDGLGGVWHLIPRIAN